MSSGNTTQPAAIAEPPTAGELLRNARESAGLHIAALAVMLKVPVKKLEALESSRFDLLPDMVFARALAASICRTLKIDAAPIMERLPHSGATTLAHQGQAINAPFRSPNDGPNRSMFPGLHKPAASAVLLLLLGTVAIAYWPNLATQLERANAFFEGRKSASAALIAQAMPGTLIDLKSEKSLIVVSNTANTANGAGAISVPVQPLNIAPASAAPLEGQPVNSAAAVTPGNVSGLAPSVGAVASVSADASVPLPALGLIVFRAVGQSWVEVTDAKKQVVLRRTLAQGESIGVSGALPLSATVGRANVTQVDVRGQSFDLIPWSKDNVARFEVK